MQIMGNDLKLGKIGEQFLLDRFSENLNWELQNKPFKEFPEVQKLGIDLFLKTSKGSIGIDIKTRRNKYYKEKDFYKDFFIETRSIISGRKNKGWIFKHGAQIIIYFWLDKTNKIPIDGYIIDLNNFRIWFKFIRTTFDQGSTGSYDGYTWKTIGRIVPNKRIPPKLVKKIDPNFFNNFTPEGVDMLVGEIVKYTV